MQQRFHSGFPRRARTWRSRSQVSCEARSTSHTPRCGTAVQRLSRHRIAPAFPKTRWQAMRQFLEAPPSVLLSRVLVGSLLLWAGLGKTGDTQTFLAEARWYGLVPFAALAPLEVALSSLEILAGIALVLGIVQPWTAAGVSALLFIFTSTMWTIIIRELFFGWEGASPAQRPAVFFASVSLTNAALDGMWFLLSVHVLWVAALRSRPLRKHRLRSDR